MLLTLPHLLLQCLCSVVVCVCVLRWCVLLIVADFIAAGDSLFSM